MQQTRFMSWNSNTQISIVDINSNPIIDQIIDIEKGRQNKSQAETDINITSKNLEVSGTIPFMDIAPFKVDEHRFHSGVLNYFKAKRRLEPSDVQGRLKRIHGVLKTEWYLDEREKTVDYMNDEEEKLNEGYMEDDEENAINFDRFIDWCRRTCSNGGNDEVSEAIL